MSIIRSDHIPGSCVLMQGNSIRKINFQHINQHLWHDEKVVCMFVGWTFKTNVFSALNTLKNRKSNPHSLKDFMPNVVNTSDQVQQSDNCADGPIVCGYESGNTKQ